MELDSYSSSSSQTNNIQYNCNSNTSTQTSSKLSIGGNDVTVYNDLNIEQECNTNESSKVQEKMVLYTSFKSKNKNYDNNQPKKNSKVTLQKEKIIKLKPLRENQYIKRYKLRTKTISDVVDVSAVKLKSGFKSSIVTKKTNEFKTHNTKNKCLSCKKLFSFDVSLNRHDKCKSCSNSKDGNHDSEESKEVLCDSSEFKSNNESLLKCQNCEEIFDVKIKLEEHVLENQCTKFKIFTCDICKGTFNCMSHLKRHIIAHLNSSANDSISTSLKTKYACNNKTGEKNICKICHKDFKDNASFQKHYKYHQNNVIKCEKCFKVFVEVEKFSKHFSECQNSGDTKQKYECDTCGNKFSNFKRLKFHILNVHQGVSYQCEKCCLKFTKKEEYDIHVTNKNCKPDEPKVCEICHKVFSKKDYLKKHQYVHTNVLFKCKYCYCAFMKEKNYKKHIEKMNCSKSARKIKLAEFNFKKCRICEVEYENENLLLNHFKTVHSGQNPHQCFCCESCLPTFQDLQDHIHQHNIQKYTCNICKKPYTSQEGFRKHRLKHKGAEFKCKFCSAEFLNENRYKFHEKNCKKNPESGHEQSNFKEKAKKKVDRPKQSRQLHWESRIIVKHLRGDPKVPSDNQQNLLENKTENPITASFFDESENEICNKRGWFDNYYKIEEDDIAFGLKKDADEENQTCDLNFNDSDFFQESKTSIKKIKEGMEVQCKEFELKTENYENEDIANFSHGYSSESSSSDSSEEEEDLEYVDENIDYNPKKCRLCVVTFSQEYELLHHFIKSHPGEHAHKCPHCEVQSPLFAQLKEHMKIHGIGIGIYNCDNCSKKFRSEKKMKSHNIRCKGLNMDFGNSKKALIMGEEHCKKCKKKFHTKFGYKRHKQLCKGKKVKTKKMNFVAEVLKKPKESFLDACADVNNIDLSDADDAMAGTEEGNLEPEENNVTTVLNDTDPQANKSVSLKEEQGEEKKKELIDNYVGEPPLDSFPCRLCEKKFQYERGIVMHFKSAHPGHKPLICPVCNMHLADKLKEHLKTHGIGEEFICGLCGKRFNQKFLSKIHEMWHQGVEYKCNNCKQKFLNKEKMEKHIGENRCSNRQSLMRLPCDICGKSYRSKFGLSKHYITHTPKELRPIKNKMNCEYCGKWFENNNGLQRHRRIHTGERPFCCRFCPKAFAQEGNCKAHEKIHTGESKPRKKKLVKVTVTPDLTSVPQPQTQLVPAIIVPQTTISSTAETIFYPGPINLYIYTGIDSNGIVH